MKEDSALTRRHSSECVATSDLVVTSGEQRFKVNAFSLFAALFLYSESEEFIMNDTLNKKELEARLKEQMAALEETKQLIAAKEASDVLMMIRNSVENHTALCERIGNLTKDERKVYIRKVVSMYEDAFDECEDEFAKIATRKRERAERRKERGKSQKQVETVAEEQHESNGGTVQQNMNNSQSAYGYVQR